MSLLESLILGLIQGLTEFLPISSSGHLALAEHFFAIELDPSMLTAFDVTVHAGTLVALLIYFRHTWCRLLKVFFNYFGNYNDPEDKELFHTLVFALIPVMIAGVLFKDQIEEIFRNPINILTVMGGTGLVFLLAEKFPKRKKRKRIGLKEGIIIGIVQAIAIIPGVSRSGITMAAGMFQGFDRNKAAEFSFLLGAPTLLAAMCYILMNMMIGDAHFPPLTQVFTGFFSSLIASWLSIHYFLKFIRSYSLNVFAYYLLGLFAIGFPLLLLT